MKPELAQQQFDFLKKRIGDQVSCKVWLWGNLMIREGILQEVKDFDSVTIDNNIIPFVGAFQAIEEIKLVSPEKIIYVNPKAVGYQIKEETNVMNAQQALLGRSILKEQLLAEEQSQAKRAR